jgi:hypothetical protein
MSYLKYKEESKMFEDIFIGDKVNVPLDDEHVVKTCYNCNHSKYDNIGLKCTLAKVQECAMTDSYQYWEINEETI